MSAPKSASSEPAVAPAEKAPLTAEEARGRRSLAIALSLAGFVALIFLITLVRLKDHVFARPL